MSFILRASVVIGLLAFFASNRDRSAPPITADKEAASAVSRVVAMANALPADVKDGIVRSSVQDLSRRLASAGASQDTLSEADRRLPWRGAAK